MKYFIFSIDDGTIYDEKVIDILNKYGFKATFNLNSGLDNFVWYKDDIPVRRNHLNEVKNIYDGHEIASHSLTHPYLTNCPDDQVFYEVNTDMTNLKNIFNQEIVTFAFPFEDFDERCINIISNIQDIKIIRLSELDHSFTFPKDLHHVKITSWNIFEALNLFEIFKEDDNAKLFVFVAHAYDFEFENTYEKLDELCRKIKKEDNVQVILMKDLINVI